MSMTDLFVTQEEYDDLVEQLVLKVADDGYKFDTILGLARHARWRYFLTRSRYAFGDFSDEFLSTGRRQTTR